MTNETKPPSNPKRQDFAREMLKLSLHQGNWLVSEELARFEWYLSNIECDVISVSVASNSRIDDMIQPLIESGLFEPEMIKANSLHELASLRTPKKLKGNTLLIEVRERMNLVSSKDFRRFLSSIVNFAAASQSKGETVRVFWMQE